MRAVSLRVNVDCYFGYKADERPRRFTLGAAAPEAPPRRTYEVTEVLDQWYGPGYQCFKVRADDTNLYILRHDQTEDTWTLEAFRSEGDRKGKG